MTRIYDNSDNLFYPAAREYGITAWLVAFFGLVLTFSAFWWIHQELSARQLLEFQWVAENRHRALNKEIDDELEAVESIRDLFLVSENVTQEDFRALAQSLLNRHRGIQALAWVPHSRAVDSPGVDVNGRDADIPVMYIEPEEKNKPLLGFDHAFDLRFRKLLNQSRDEGAMVISERIRLGQAIEDQYGFAAFLPVFRKSLPTTTASRREHLEGHAVGVFQITELAKIATAVLEPRGVEFLIRDELAADDQKFLGFYSSRLSHPSLSLPTDWKTWIRKTDPNLTHSLQVADRDWKITYAPTAQFLTAEGFQQGPFVVLASGLLLTFLMTLYLLRIKQMAQIRTKMEHTLREREELFRQMTDAIQEVFWIQTPDLSHVLYVSPAYEKIWGRSRESLYQAPSSFLEGVHPQDREDVAATLGKIPEGETEHVFRVVRPDGSMRWVRSREFTVYNDRDEIYRVAGIREDITEIKQAENALRKSEKELKTLFNQSPDIIKTVDKAGRILTVNRSLPELPDEEAIGRDSSELLPPEYRKRYRRLLKKVFQKGKSDHFQYATADSEWWDVRMVPIRRDDKVIEAMVLDTDITETKTLQEQAIRNARLASLGVLAASVAHEINNPNNAIQFNASVLARVIDEALPIVRSYQEENGDFLLGGMQVDKALETVPQLLAGIKNSSLRIQKIVGNLKHMSRHDRRDLFQDVDILEVLQAAASILRNQIHKHTDHFTLKSTDGFPPVVGNDQQLEQVFINIIMNALQALPDRSCGVEIRTFLDEARHNIIVEVQDEGRGIPEGEIGKVKEPFFTTREESGGTGLGLSISDMIVRKHKGRIKFLSEPGRGTTVAVKLPVSSNAPKASRHD